MFLKTDFYLNHHKIIHGTGCFSVLFPLVRPPWCIKTKQRNWTRSFISIGWKCFGSLGFKLWSEAESLVNVDFMFQMKRTRSFFCSTINIECTERGIILVKIKDEKIQKWCLEYISVRWIFITSFCFNSRNCNFR